MTFQPPGEATTRFLADLAALAGGLPERLAVAVSGGPDSLALLLLAAAALPGRVQAATVDHGIRPESAAEAQHVASICAAIGCPHDILCVTVDRANGVQAGAREARYSGLACWAVERGLRHLATAHHIDDQAETLLMRLQRGSGVAGLAAIRPVRRESELLILRPLLGWTKAELAAVVAAAGIEPIDDPSNRDPRFDRTLARGLLAANPALDPAALARSAAALRDADESLEWAVERLWTERVSQQGDMLLLAPEGLPAELKRRILKRILSRFDPSGRPRGEQLGRLLEALERQETATLSGVKCSGGVLWQFEPAPPRRDAVV